MAMMSEKKKKENENKREMNDIKKKGWKKKKSEKVWKEAAIIKLQKGNKCLGEQQ